MSSIGSVKTIKHQQGLALLVLIIVILLASVTYSLSDLSIWQVRVDQAKNTMVILKKAKQAVINYAVTYADRAAGNDYGLLPCPEVQFNSDDGNMTGNCGFKNRNVLGWFPWRSLDLSDLKDDSGTCLFYAVSGTYRVASSTQADMINEDSIGMFQIVNSAGVILQGANTEEQVVALVIASGGPLTGQARNPTVDTSNCGRDYTSYSAYLEGDGVTDNSTVSSVVDTIDQFIHATETSSSEATPYNDKFLTITRDEVWNAIVERTDFKQKMENLTQALAMCLADYTKLAGNSSRRLPWPVKTDLGVTTNYRNNINYVDDDSAVAGFSGYSGRFPFDVTNSNAANAGVFSSANLFDAASCSALNLTGSGLGVTANLQTTTSEYRKLWDNWKDHFFYVLSQVYEPENAVAKECNVAPFTALNPKNCIEVNGVKYAGAVIFSGSRLDIITRNDKSVMADYLEDGKAAVFTTEAINKTGIENYIYTDPQTNVINDVMYCIRNNAVGSDLDVIECI